MRGRTNTNVPTTTAIPRPPPSTCRFEILFRIAVGASFPNPSRAGRVNAISPPEPQVSAEVPRAAFDALDAYVHCPYTDRMAKVARATDRWAFRVEAQADELVRRAADVSHRTLTDFVVEAAVVEADRVLGDRTRFVLEDERWMRFVALLDRPPQENPGLTKLFAKPSIFE